MVIHWPVDPGVAAVPVYRPNQQLACIIRAL